MVFSFSAEQPTVIDRSISTESTIDDATNANATTIGDYGYDNTTIPNGSGEVESVNGTSPVSYTHLTLPTKA